MNNKILLISETYLKEHSSLSENVFGKYILPAIKEAQEMNLVQVIGECLYNVLCDMVDSGDISLPENEVYKELLDNYVMDFLVYAVQSNLVPLLNAKLGNIGSVVSNDEHIQTLSQTNVELLVNYFKERADFYAKRCQEFVMKNKEAIKLCDCSCWSVKGSDYLSASGIFLG